MNTKQLAAIGVMLIAVLACAIPGISQPAPLDPATLPTIVVLTVNAATTQTAAANPIVPSDPGVVEATPLPVNETGMEAQADGSVKFVHVSGGYEITYPVGWLTVRPNSEEFNAAYANDASRNSTLLDQMNSDMEAYDPEFDQLFSYILRPDLIKDTLFGFSDLDWDANDNNTIDEVTMGKLIDNIETSMAIPGFRLDTAQIYENPNGVKLLELGGQFSISDGQDGILPFYTTIIFFKPAETTSTRVSFTYLKDFKPELQPDVTNVINSIRLLGQ